jgi:hypothetical protein
MAASPHHKNIQALEENPMARFNWSEYQPTKTVWFWSIAGCVIATLILGFTWGGWVTGGTAEEMAASAREEGRAQLAANICVDQFLDGPDVAVKLAELKEESEWSRDDYIEEGGWATFAKMEEPVDGAAQLCATELAEMELPAANEEAASGTAEKAVN